MRFSFVPAVAALGVLAAVPAAAQTVPATRPGPRVGVLAGLNSATISADAADAGPTERRNGVVGGVYLAFPFARYVAFRPELLYVQKGASGEAEDDLSAAVQLDYVELPLLVEATVPTAGRVRPQVYAGPAVGYQARCRVEARDGGVSLGGSCDAFTDDPGGAGERRVELSGVVGGAVAFGVGARALTLGVRYTHGFTKVFDASSAKNRAVGVYGSVEFPLRRRRR